MLSTPTINRRRASSLVPTYEKVFSMLTQRLQFTTTFIGADPNFNEIEAFIVDQCSLTDLSSLLDMLVKSKQSTDLLTEILLIASAKRLAKHQESTISNENKRILLTKIPNNLISLLKQMLNACCKWANRQKTATNHISFVSTLTRSTVALFNLEFFTSAADLPLNIDDQKLLFGLCLFLCQIDGDIGIDHNISMHNLYKVSISLAYALDSLDNSHTKYLTMLFSAMNNRHEAAYVNFWVSFISIVQSKMMLLSDHEAEVLNAHLSHLNDQSKCQVLTERLLLVVDWDRESHSLVLIKAFIKCGHALIHHFSSQQNTSSTMPGYIELLLLTENPFNFDNSLLTSITKAQWILLIPFLTNQCLSFSSSNKVKHLRHILFKLFFGKSNTFNFPIDSVDGKLLLIVLLCSNEHGSEALSMLLSLKPPSTKARWMAIKLAYLMEQLTEWTLAAQLWHYSANYKEVNANSMDEEISFIPSLIDMIIRAARCAGKANHSNDSDCTLANQLCIEALIAWDNQEISHLTTLSKIVFDTWCLLPGACIAGTPEIKQKVINILQSTVLPLCHRQGRSAERISQLIEHEKKQREERQELAQVDMNAVYKLCAKYLMHGYSDEITEIGVGNTEWSTILNLLHQLPSPDHSRMVNFVHTLITGIDQLIDYGTILPRARLIMALQSTQRIKHTSIGTFSDHLYKKLASMERAFDFLRSTLEIASICLTCCSYPSHAKYHLQQASQVASSLNTPKWQEKIDKLMEHITNLKSEDRLIQSHVEGIQLIHVKSKAHLKFINRVQEGSLPYIEHLRELWHVDVMHDLSKRHVLIRQVLHQLFDLPLLSLTVAQLAAGLIDLDRAPVRQFPFPTPEEKIETTFLSFDDWLCQLRLNGQHILYSNEDNCSSILVLLDKNQQAIFLMTRCFFLYRPINDNYHKLLKKFNELMTENKATLKMTKPSNGNNDQHIDSSFDNDGDGMENTAKKLDFTHPTRTKSSIDESSPASLSQEEVLRRRKWWTSRRSLDSALSKFITECQEKLFGPFAPLMLMTRYYHTKSQTLIEELTFDMMTASKLNSRHKMKVPSLDALAEIVQSIYPSQVTSDICERLRRALVRKQLDLDEEQSATLSTTINDKNLFQVTLAQYDSFQSQLTYCLFLDKLIQWIPWESMPILRIHQAIRIPRLMLDSPKNQKLFISSTWPSVSYILNPSGDLKDTEQRMTEYFRKWNEEHGSIKGIHGPLQDNSKSIFLIPGTDLLLYYGHAGGEPYCSLQDILANDNNYCGLARWIWLIGCSSAKLKYWPSLTIEPESVTLGHLQRGSELVVGMLWDVTDRDIDNWSIRCLDKLRSEEEGLSAMSIAALARAVSQARLGCTLPWMTGSAPVLYARNLSLFTK